jgi:arylsulfatase A-like enzyme
MFTMNDRFTGTPLREWTDTKKQPPTPPTDADYEDVLPRTTDATIEYLARRAADNRPFFAYVTPMAPHSPLSVVKSWQGRSGLGIYADYVMELDAEIGRILAALDRHGLADNTLVMVTSDNGCAAYVNVKALEAKGHFPSERSRGYKADLWDGGHRIPFLVRWPGKVAPGSRCDHPVCLSDLMATCAEIVGERLPDNAGEDSVSLLPLLQGQRGPARDSVIHHSMLGKFAIRQGKWKLLLCAGSGCGTQPDDFRAEKMGLPKQQLYDMEADPGERNNLQAKHPEIVERLTKLLYKQINDGRSTPGKPQANDVPIDVWKRPDLMSWNIRAVLEQKE